MLGPVAQYSDTNDTSIVLRIDYGSTSFWALAFSLSLIHI